MFVITYGTMLELFIARELNQGKFYVLQIEKTIYYTNKVVPQAYVCIGFLLFHCV